MIDTFCDLFYSFFVVVYMIVSAVHNQHLFKHSDKYEQVRLASRIRVMRILLFYLV